MRFMIAARGGTAAWTIAALASAVSAGVEGAEDLPESLLSAPAVTGLINDGDESVVETVYVYLDGCPILSITPPPSGRGDPEVTVLKAEGDCVATDGSGTTLEYLSAMGLGIEQGMHVKLQRDSAEDPEQGRNALIVDIANLYPEAPVRNGQRPRFWIPGVFGDPSGSLVVPTGSNSGGSSPTPAVLFGNTPPMGAPGTGSGGGSNTGLPGAGGSSGGGGGGFVPSDPNGPGGPSAGTPPAPAPAPIPLPASLLLLMGALIWLRSFVYRRPS